jgi:exopolysaccharide biosynthesis predicted pyruvyltransferase EpsI
MDRIVKNLALNLIERLQRTLTEAAGHYGVTAGPYALVDFPNHPNVGDSAIWAGELNQLTALLGAPPAYVCHYGNYSKRALKAALPSGPIFIHGGGNFGDIWPNHHRLREAVISDFTDRRIIQLPQTVYFEEQRFEETAKIIRNHKNFILFVRDQSSFERAELYFDCPVHLAPDMAFCVGPIARPIPPEHKLLLLLRTDKETARTEGFESIPEDAIVADWLDEEPNFRRRKFKNRLSSPSRFLEFAFSQNVFKEAFYEDLALSRIDRGARLLSSAEHVITDRLHSHILCVLLGIPHTVLDNSYGKLSAFIEAWTKSCPFLTLSPSLDEALQRQSQGNLVATR